MRSISSNISSRALNYYKQNEHLRNTIIATMIKFIGAVLSLLLNFLIAHQFGPIGIGQFGLAVTTITLASTAAIFGLDYILVRTVSGDLKVGKENLARGAIRTVGIFCFCNALILFTILQLEVSFGPWLNSEASGLVLRAVTFGVVPMTLMRFTSSSLRSCGYVILSQILDGPMSMFISIAAIFLFTAIGISGSIVNIGVIYFLAMSCSVTVGIFILFRTLNRWAPPENVALMPLLSQSWPILFIVFIGFFIDWLILVTLSSYHSATDVGLFRTAWQIASIFNLVIVSFDAVSGPRIAAAHRIGDQSGISRTWRQAVVIILCLTSPLFLVSIVFPEYVMGLFGNSFVAGANVLRILALAQLVNVLTGPIGSVLIMTGGERYSLANSLLSLGLALITTLTLIPTYGLTGAAIASALTLSIRNLVAWMIVTFKLRLPLLRG